MAKDGRGGYRAPSSPAPVSGPGALSRRTDGGPGDTQGAMVAPGGAYGSRQQMEALQQAAPMQGGGGGTPQGGSLPPAQGTPLDAPTARPDEPVTAGADLGAGPSASEAGIQSDAQATISQLSPLVNSLTLMANLPSSTPQFRAFVRRLQVQVNQQQGF